jgi:hypothetical protein
VHFAPNLPLMVSLRVSVVSWPLDFVSTALVLGQECSVPEHGRQSQTGLKAFVLAKQLHESSD